ncbi:hypothetical protein C1645_830889 [Glomus cerebriforme]|uniref:Uncharacterized protein n=1 Tax=Glomus cerebriforme TaxID=658196 RepID=A0A397SKE1_9GLOM|nr:hypothetical protein C1645_830889 [Glomus cerebriforme]
MTSEIALSIENFILLEDKNKITSATLVYKAGLANNLLSYEKLQEEIRIGVDSALIKLESSNEEKSTNEMSNFNDISKNIIDLRRSLAITSDVDTELCDGLLDSISDIKVEELDWRSPIASKVINDKSLFIESLNKEALLQFMVCTLSLKIVYMLSILPEGIINKCRKFPIEFKNNLNSVNIKMKFIHDSTWKESLTKQKKVVDNIFLVTREIWNNPIYSNHESRKRLNEGSYFTDVINPYLRAALSGIFGNDMIYFTMQSIASKSRKNENLNHTQIGKKPNAILVLYTNNIKYELLYVECSQILCYSQKQDDDSVKLWRVCNDESEIPLTPCGSDELIDFNILITNISILLKAIGSKLQQCDSITSTTINSPTLKKLVEVVMGLNLITTY